MKSCPFLAQIHNNLNNMLADSCLGAFSHILLVSSQDLLNLGEEHPGLVQHSVTNGK